MVAISAIAAVVQSPLALGPGHSPIYFLSVVVRGHPGRTGEDHELHGSLTMALGRGVPVGEKPILESLGNKKATEHGFGCPKLRLFLSFWGYLIRCEIADWTFLEGQMAGTYRPSI